MADILGRGDIRKLDEDQHLVFGWAYIAKRASGEQVVDHSGDFVDEFDGLEDAAYDYVLNSREGDEMHATDVAARLVESMTFTPDKLRKMGIAPDAVPTGWWVGFKVENADTWAKVKAGELTMFSIQGTGEREVVGKKYNPNQPRDPAGEPTGGRWSAEGGGGGSYTEDIGPNGVRGITSRAPRRPDGEFREGATVTVSGRSGRFRIIGLDSDPRPRVWVVDIDNPDQELFVDRRDLKVING